MIELRADRLPEAVYYWNQALKHDKDYRAAKLNLGFYALKYGDAATAVRMLSNIRADWFVNTGLAQAYRLQGKGL